MFQSVGHVRCNLVFLFWSQKFAPRNSNPKKGGGANSRVKKPRGDKIIPWNLVFTKVSISIMTLTMISFPNKETMNKLERHLDIMKLA
jgi:hypothetical protein